MMGSSLCLFTCMQFVFSLIFFKFIIATNFNASMLLPLCHDDERSALLRFKDRFIIYETNSSSCRPKTASWKHKEEGNSNDCCSWDGVHCNQNTGHVIKLDLSNSCLYGSINSSSSLFNLSHLQWLNLAFNDFNFSKIQPEIINLSRLSYLNLSSSSFSGQIPSEILELSNLVSLDLSRSLDLQFKKPSLGNLAEKLTNLRELHLDYVTIASPIPHNLANLSSLTFLSMPYCQLRGKIPSSLGNLTRLTHLDLSLNELLGGHLPTSIGNLGFLETLDLSNNELLGGQLPTSIGNLDSLEILDLSNNELLGQLPTSIGNLTQLSSLDLSYNNFSGEFPYFIGNLRSLKELDLSYCNFSGQIPPSLGNLTRLQRLVLSSNNFLGELPAFIGNLRSLYIDSCNFSGQIPPSLGNLTQLQHLVLSYNNFFGELPASIGNFSSLVVLDISSCHFSGRIPSSFSNLTQLYHLDLSMNHFNGTMELDMFLIDLKNLQIIYLSSNKLSLITKSTFNITTILFIVALNSCGLTEFPDFLKNQKQLRALDLSSNKIHGKVPRWLLDPSMQDFGYLNLSHNFLTGFDQHPVVFPWSTSHFFILDLSSNFLQGLLPVPPAKPYYYLVSNNSLTGEIPSWICNANYLEILDLSHNNLSGEIPLCLGNFSDELAVLDLNGNNLFGTIPDTFTNGSSLKMIDLSDNLLQGRIPRSLANCTMLEFLNLGNNQISDTFPVWLGSLFELNVLILRGNNFYGELSEPKTECGFPKLRIIDLSNNKFRGKLPSKYFQCWDAMKFVNTSRLRYMEDFLCSFFSLVFYGYSPKYGYSLTINQKGQMLSYDKIPDILTGIILSNNKFDGEIPKSIANLKDLQVLSLANNNLQGHIPSCLRNLTELESLDLSSNRFSGQIPQQLVELTFLEFFNVSHNNLTGPIPQGKQFSTFDNTSFDGNTGLCGKPLSKECENSEATTTNEDDVGVEGSESPFALDWKIVLIGYLGGLIAGVALGLSFSTGIVEWILEKLGTR